jgi:hypothetical protein
MLHLLAAVIGTKRKYRGKRSLVRFRSEADKARAAAYLLPLICSCLPCSEFLHVEFAVSASQQGLQY